MESYIRKLEDENAKLNYERNFLFQVLKSVSSKSKLDIKYDDALNSITPEMLNEYILKKYPVVDTRRTAWEHVSIVEIGGKQHSVITWRKPSTNNKEALEAAITQHSILLFKAVWIDYTSQFNKGSLNLLLEILSCTFQ